MSRLPPSTLVWVLFLALAIVWGSSFLFIKIGLNEGTPPLTLIAWRLAIGACLLYLVARLSGARRPAERSTVLKLVALSLVNVAVPFVLITWAELHIDSAVASVLNGTVPLFAIFIAGALLHDEPITLNRLVGLAIGFAGATVLLSRDLGAAGGGPGDPLQLAGQVAMVLASLLYAIGGVLVRRLFTGRPLVETADGRRRPLLPVELALAQCSVAAFVTIGLAAVLDWTRPGASVVPPSPQAWLAVTWLGLLGSGVAYLLFFRIIEAWGATRTALVTYVMPVVGIILGVVVLRETVDARVLAGTALVIGGIALVNSRFGQRRLYGRSAPLGAPER